MNPRRTLAAAAWAWPVIGCGAEPAVLPPRGEALIVVDTDAAVPALAGRLRVDVYADDGTWVDSGDFPARRPEDWPGSFSVYVDPGSATRTAIVRLRAYADAKVRDYRGERFLARPSGGDPAALVLPPPGDGLPRLVQGGVDVTPATEPLPNLAIDRLLAVRLEDGHRARTRVLLAGACVATMADLFARETCVDAENVRVPTIEAPSDEDMSLPGPSGRVGTFGAEVPCTAPVMPGGVGSDGAPLDDDEVCVPGGSFVLGSPEVVVAAAEEETLEGDKADAFNAVPERLALMAPLRIDRYEVTVRRFRHAVDALGFVPPTPPHANDGPLAKTLADSLKLCTYSTAPLGREDYPLNCVGFGTAQAFCEFFGGSLPTEAEWEYVATAAGRAVETRYPWGFDPPTCARAVYGRIDQADPKLGASECSSLGIGPQPLAASVPNGEGIGDVAVPLDVIGLGGSLSEWLLDAYRSFSSVCWASQSMSEPRCIEEAPEFRTYRGGAWHLGAGSLSSAARRGILATNVGAYLGFRCVRPGE